MKLTKLIKIQTLVAVILMILSGVTATLSQAPAPKQNSAETSRLTQVAPNTANVTPVPDCATELELANQRLVKTLDAYEKAKALIATLEDRSRIQNDLERLNKELLAAKDETVRQQAALIELLKKQQGRKFSLLFGLVKIRF